MYKDGDEMKVEIKRTKLSDAKELRELMNCEEVIKQLIGYQYPCPLSHIKKDISNGLKDWKKKKAYPFTILVDKKIAGQIILENPNKEKGRYDIGFFIGKKYWNKGVATKAVKETIKFGFKTLKLYRIQGDNDSDNLASGKVMKKAGFKFEGKRKKINKKNGKYIDLLLWGKTK